MAKLLLRRVVAGEPLQGWHIVILSEAARYGWQPPVRNKQPPVRGRQPNDSGALAQDLNAAMDYLMGLLPDQYQLEMQDG